MPYAFTDDLASVDWDELSALHRAAPLGEKSPADLKLVFANSMFRVFVSEDGRLVGAGRAVAGREPFYEAFRFRRMTAAMALFEDPAKVRRNGYLD